MRLLEKFAFAEGRNILRLLAVAGIAIPTAFSKVTSASTNSPGTREKIFDIIRSNRGEDYIFMNQIFGLILRRIENLYLLNRDEEALGELERVRLLSTRMIALSQYEGAVCRLMGLELNKLGKINEAIAKHYQDVQISRFLRDRPKEASAYKDVAICFYRLGEYKDSMTIHINHLQMGKEDKDNAAICIAYGNIGLCLLHLERLQEAEIVLNRSIALSITSGKKYQTAVISARLAQCYYLAGDLDRALLKYNECLAACVVYQDNVAMALVHIDIGLCYLEKKQYSKAITSMKCSAALLESLKPPDPSRLAQALFHLAKCHFYNRNYSSCIRNVKKCLLIFNSSFVDVYNGGGVLDKMQTAAVLQALEDTRRSYRLLALSHIYSGDYLEALVCLESCRGLVHQNCFARKRRPRTQDDGEYARKDKILESIKLIHAPILKYSIVSIGVSESWLVSFLILPLEFDVSYSKRRDEDILGVKPFQTVTTGGGPLDSVRIFCHPIDYSHQSSAGGGDVREWASSCRTSLGFKGWYVAPRILFTKKAV